MFDLTHKENIMKTRKTITPNIPLRGHRVSTKSHPEVGRVALLMQEILKKHYSVESRRGKNIENQLQNAP